MLEVKGISKHYKNKQILNGITSVKEKCMKS